MAWVGTAMTPLAVRTLMAPDGPSTSWPHRAWPVVPVMAVAVAAVADGHQPEKAGEHCQDQRHDGEPDSSA